MIYQYPYPQVFGAVEGSIMGNPTKKYCPALVRKSASHRSCREAEDFACLSEEENPKKRTQAIAAGRPRSIPGHVYEAGSTPEGHIYYVGVKYRRCGHREASTTAKDQPRGEAKGHHQEVTQGEASKEVFVPGYSNSKQTLRRPSGALSGDFPPN